MAEAFDKLIAALAERQFGYITRAQLLALGLGRRAIQSRVDDRPADPRPRRGVRGRPPQPRSGRPGVRRRPGVWRARRAAQPRIGRDALGLQQALGHAVRGHGRHVAAPASRHRDPPQPHPDPTRDRDRHHGIPVTSPARTTLDYRPAPHRPAPDPRWSTMARTPRACTSTTWSTPWTATRPSRGQAPRHLAETRPDGPPGPSSRTPSWRSPSATACRPRSPTRRSTAARSTRCSPSKG